MPTPAVNIVNEVTSPGYYTYVNPPALGGNTVQSLRTISLFREERRRPASVSHPVVNGWRPPTPWNHSWLYTRNTGGDVLYQRTNRPASSSSPVSMRWEKGAGFYTSGPSGSVLTRPTTPSGPSWLKAKCEIGALTKLQLGDFDLGVFLAEGKETIHTVSSAMQSIACQVTAFRRSNPKKVWDAIVRYEGVGTEQARKLFRKYGSKWLALQYGWRPLLSDAMAAMSDLDRLRRVQPPLIKVAKQEGTTFNQEYSVSGGLGTIRYGQLFDITATCTLWYRLTNPTMAQLASLGLLNPASILWEKLPYSFVVDWFAPVGGWLNALGADLGFSFQGGCYGVKSELVDEGPISRVHSRPTSDTWEVFDDFQMSTRQGKFVRTVYTSSPVPGLYVKNPISLEHMANATALLTQAFR